MASTCSNRLSPQGRAFRSLRQLIYSHQLKKAQYLLAVSQSMQFHIPSQVLWIALLHRQKIFLTSTFLGNSMAHQLTTLGQILPPFILKRMIPINQSDRLSVASPTTHLYHRRDRVVLCQIKNGSHQPKTMTSPQNLYAVNVYLARKPPTISWKRGIV